MPDLPAWAREPVQIVEADPGWMKRAEHERDDLQARLSPCRLSGVEHVGSTAVEGLAAKPIVDLQVLIADLDLTREVAPAIAAADWHLVPAHLDRRPWRRFFVQVRRERRVAHLHLMMPGTARWEEQLIFRNALRRDPGLVRRYAALKRDLARCHDDHESYSLAKAQFVRAVLDANSDTSPETDN